MARSRSAGLALVIGTEYNDRDLKNLQRDLDRLKQKSRQADGPFKKLGNSIKNNAGPALAAAGAAAAYMAVQMGVDAVKAAAEEEKQLANLGMTLKNLGVAFDMKELDKFIQSMQFATGVSDDELRVAFTNLVRATKDVSSAQDLLKLALDVSAGSGKSLTTVTTALSKAQTGNFSTLKRLVPTIDQTAVANKDLNAVVKSLSDQFSGSAAAAADTFSGKVAILTQVAGEVQQAFGAGFLQAFLDTSDVLDGTGNKMEDLMKQAEDLGTTVGGVLGNIIEALRFFRDAWGQTTFDPSEIDNAGEHVDLFAMQANDASQAYLDFADVVTTTSLTPVMANLGILNTTSNAAISQLLLNADALIQAIRSRREAETAADQAGADAASAAAETARALAEKTKRRTQAIVDDINVTIDKAKAAQDEFRSIRKGYVQAAREDAAITTFAPEGKVTARGIEANIRQRLGLIKKFAAAIKSLQGKLNGAALADIIAQGPVAGLPYAQALANDAATVGRINKLQSQLATPAGTIGRIGAELATGTTAAKLAAAETFTNKYVVGKDAINITVNGELTAGQRRQLKQAVREALSGIGREGKNGKKVNIK